MSAVNSVTGTTPNTQTNTTSSASSVMGKDEFLKLLISELKNQDPLEPMDNKEFISQMASFSSLEQMNNMVSGFTDLTKVLKSSLLPNVLLQQASSYLGAEVEYTKGDEKLAGVVQQVSIVSGTPYLVVDGNKVDLSNVIAIRLADQTTEETSTDGTTTPTDDTAAEDTTPASE
ncbi:MAG: flagellar hook capping FlgD N-terminal domain-containing protein [Ignavibacteriales bacterium]